ncbi:hypothetical protein KIN20_010046 [Parelaphostrongylus tenuis]|uniref:Uncharacterized protein n=1 Tax=Parelaphostrongylus tenuis TaxID=148309 RepID=A0AAD5MTE3_PARTN|nr:hypothetical protein KIN20_010046 [Parelaphostrongylus tenuis]
MIRLFSKYIVARSRCHVWTVVKEAKPRLEARRSQDNRVLAPVSTWTNSPNASQGTTLAEWVVERNVYLAAVREYLACCSAGVGWE